jgi:hypothetical protein
MCAGKGQDGTLKQNMPPDRSCCQTSETSKRLAFGQAGERGSHEGPSITRLTSCRTCTLRPACPYRLSFPRHTTSAPPRALGGFASAWPARPRAQLRQPSLRRHPHQGEGRHAAPSAPRGPTATAGGAGNHCVTPVDEGSDRGESSVLRATGSSEQGSSEAAAHALHIVRHAQRETIARAHRLATHYDLGGNGTGG